MFAKAPQDHVKRSVSEPECPADSPSETGGRGGAKTPKKMLCCFSFNFYSENDDFGPRAPRGPFFATAPPAGRFGPSPAQPGPESYGPVSWWSENHNLTREVSQKSRDRPPHCSHSKFFEQQGTPLQSQQLFSPSAAESNPTSQPGRPATSGCGCSGVPCVSKKLLWLQCGGRSRGFCDTSREILLLLLHKVAGL